MSALQRDKDPVCARGFAVRPIRSLPSFLFSLLAFVGWLVGWSFVPPFDRLCLMPAAATSMCQSGVKGPTEASFRCSCPALNGNKPSGSDWCSRLLLYKYWFVVTPSIRSRCHQQASAINQSPTHIITSHQQAPAPRPPVVYVDRLRVYCTVRSFTGTTTPHNPAKGPLIPGNCHSPQQDRASPPQTRCAQ